MSELDPFSPTRLPRNFAGQIIPAEKVYTRTLTIRDLEPMVELMRISAKTAKAGDGMDPVFLKYILTVCPELSVGLFTSRPYVDPAKLQEEENKKEQGNGNGMLNGADDALKDKGNMTIPKHLEAFVSKSKEDNNKDTLPEYAELEDSVPEPKKNNNKDTLPEYAELEGSAPKPKEENNKEDKNTTKKDGKGSNTSSEHKNSDDTASAPLSDSDEHWETTDSDNDDDAEDTEESDNYRNTGLPLSMLVRLGLAQGPRSTSGRRSRSPPKKSPVKKSNSTTKSKSSPKPTSLQKLDPRTLPPQPRTEILLGFVVGSKSIGRFVHPKSILLPTSHLTMPMHQDPVPCGHVEAGDMLVLQGLYVHPLHQHRGFGRIVAMEWIQRMGGAGVAKRCGAVVPSKVGTWLEGLCGFKDTGKRHGGGVGEVWTEWVLERLEEVGKEEAE